MKYELVFKYGDMLRCVESDSPKELLRLLNVKIIHLLEDLVNPMKSDDSFII